MSESVDVSASAGAAGPSRPAWVLYAGGAFVVALVLIIGAGLLIRGGDASSPGGPAVRPTYEPTPSPTWNATPLAGVTLPPLRGAQYPGEPPSYIMEDRIWDYIGPGWGLGVFMYNVDLEPRDTAAFQGIYLISPEGYPFLLHKLRTDFYLGVDHWDPTERKAWLKRCGEGDSCQVVEFDIVPGEAIEAWVVDAGTTTTISDATYLTSLAGGTSVWQVGDEAMADQRLLTRVPGGPTVVVESLRNLGSDATQAWAPFWIDSDAGVAYVRRDTVTSEVDSYHFDSSWSQVDLSTGTATVLATTPREPSDFVAFQAGFDVVQAWDFGRCGWTHTMIDGWVVEQCGELAVTSPDLPGMYLIDPTGVADPIPYGGALPQLAASSTAVTAAEYGLPIDAGWGAIIRALPLP